MNRIYSSSKKKKNNFRKNISLINEPNTKLNIFQKTNLENYRSDKKAFEKKFSDKTKNYKELIKEKNLLLGFGKKGEITASNTIPYSVDEKGKIKIYVGIGNYEENGITGRFFGGTIQTKFEYVKKKWRMEYIKASKIDVDKDCICAAIREFSEEVLGCLKKIEVEEEEIVEEKKKKFEEYSDEEINGKVRNYLHDEIKRTIELLEKETMYNPKIKNVPEAFKLNKYSEDGKAQVFLLNLTSLGLEIDMEKFKERVKFYKKIYGWVEKEEIGYIDGKILKERIKKIKNESINDTQLVITTSEIKGYKNNLWKDAKHDLTLFKNELF